MTLLAIAICESQLRLAGVCVHVQNMGISYLMFSYEFLIYFMRELAHGVYSN